jgi:outer membrane protein OmpA-like peptidoglycan-associated protein
VSNIILKVSRQLAAFVSVGAIILTFVTSAVFAQETNRVVRGENYTPAIWVDPDGCEHWVMDDGWEGYMDNRLDREGRPVCRRSNICAVLPSDQLFATDKYSISASGRRSLTDFFNKEQAVAFRIVGHTDSRASDAYNMRLSENRANAVANIARAAGARVAEVRGLGERQPKATNSTVAGMAQNRRVEIICIR